MQDNKVGARQESLEVTIDRLESDEYALRSAGEDKAADEIRDQLRSLQGKAAPRSYKVGVKTAGDSDWNYNGLRFTVRADADEYGANLAMRWTAVRDYEVHASDEEPNR